MTKSKTTKRALLLSALSLLICVSMLVGSTFAWFTDSVTSAGNIIKSGTLDVTMDWADGKSDPASAIWTDASTGAIFNYDLWEPGYTEVRHVRIANAGNLALKYQLNIVANGTVSKLADVIDVYYVDPAVQVADRTALAGVAKLGTLAEVLDQISTTASGSLLAGESDVITIALKMQESAGNEYQNLSIGSDFAIQLLATQYTYEEDSFDDQYDAASTYLNKDKDGNWLIATPGDMLYFAQQVNSGNDFRGETVKLTADIDLGAYNWTPIGAGDVYGKWIGFNGIFDGQNHTVSNVKVTKGGGWNGLFGLVGRGTTGVTEVISNLTVKNVTIEDANRMTGGIVGQLYGNLENCHVENVKITAVPNAVASGYDNGDKIGGIVGWLGDNGNNHYAKNCTAKNVTLKAYRDVGGIAGYIGSSITVENCAVDTVSIMVDQATNHYGDKDANAGAIVGRIYKQPVTIQNNTEANVTIVVTDVVMDATKLKDALTAGHQVILAADITLDTAVTFDKYADINLNGHTLTTVGMTLSNGGAIENGTIESAGNTYLTPHIKLSGGSFEMTNVTVDVKHHLNANANWSEAVGMEITDGTAVLNNCDIKINNTTKARWVFSYAISLTNAEVTVNGGSITAACIDGTATNGPTNPNAISTIGACTATLNNVAVDALYYATTVAGHLTLNTTDKTITSADIVDNQGGTHTLNYID